MQDRMGVWAYVDVVDVPTLGYCVHSRPLCPLRPLSPIRPYADPARIISASDLGSSVKNQREQTK